MKILVTGAAGFIGSFLSKALLERGDEVIGLDNINNYYNPELKYGRLEFLGIKKADIQYGKKVSSYLYIKSFYFIQLNLEDKDALLELFAREKFDAVANMAAQAGVRYSLEEPTAYINSNIMGFLNVLESCRNNPVQHLVYASSSSVYGLNKKIPFSVNDRTDNPASLYAATKKSNELMAHTYSHLFKIPATGLRFFTVYGPWGRPDMAYFLFTKAIIKGKPIKVFNQGNLLRDFTYIDDIISGIIKVLDNPPNSEIISKAFNSDFSKFPVVHKIYNIGNNKPVKLLDFIHTIEQALGKEALKEMVSMQPGDVEITFADIDDLKKDFGFEPKIDISEGINLFVNWYINNEMINSD